jgi:hypothetical protein
MLQAHPGITLSKLRVILIDQLEWLESPELKMKPVFQHTSDEHEFEKFIPSLVKMKC